MDPLEYIAAIEDDLALIAAAAEGPLTGAVAGCPGWNLAELLYHLGSVHRFWTRIVADRVEQFVAADVQRPVRPDDGDLRAWSRDCGRDLLTALRDVEPDQPVWTWSDDHTAGWVLRRQAHETSVHRWDAQRAVGEPDPISGPLAIDGIAEFFTEMLGSADGTLCGSVHLHATDSPGEWWLEQADESWVVEAQHRKGDVALRGTASDLLLALWRRIPMEELDAVGDADLGRRFLSLGGRA